MLLNVYVISIWLMELVFRSWAILLTYLQKHQYLLGGRGRFSGKHGILKPCNEIQEKTRIQWKNTENFKIIQKWVSGFLTVETLKVRKILYGGFKSKVL